MATLAEKLKDPRWQTRRLKILQRDEWACQLCSDMSAILVVHHRYCIEAGDPWDAPDEAFVTLCQRCNEREQTDREHAEQALIVALRRRGAFNADLLELAAQVERVLEALRKP